jgi:hypothetical protein
MIYAELKLHFRYDADVVIIPFECFTEPNSDSRPIVALRVGDIVQDCRLLDKRTQDCFDLPKGITWRFNELRVDPAVSDHRMRVVTLVRVGP